MGVNKVLVLLGVNKVLVLLQAAAASDATHAVRRTQDTPRHHIPHVVRPRVAHGREAAASIRRGVRSHPRSSVFAAGLVSRGHPGGAWTASNGGRRKAADTGKVEGLCSVKRHLQILVCVVCIIAAARLLPPLPFFWIYICPA